MNILCKIPFLLILYVLRFTKAQDDPQDIAAIACASTTSIYEFNSVDGYIESPNYPDEYDDNDDCQWYINPTGGIPDGQELYLQLEFFDTESCCDEIYVREGEGIYGELVFELAGEYGAGQFFPAGNVPVTLQFDPDSSVTEPGFRIYFYIGEESPGQIITDIACSDDTMPAVLLNNTNTLETPNFPSDYPDGTECQWVITPENEVNGLYLSVLYFYTYYYLYIYFGDDPTGSDYETYWYGSYDVGYSLYNPGNTMSLRFVGSYNYPGFRIVYYQSDPACTTGSASVIEVGDKAELKSPGYPYDIPEHLSCRWLLEAPEGQKVALTSLDFNLYGDGVECTDEYVEILDGDAVDALSLGKFCGDVTFGTIPSTTSALQVYLRTHDDSTDDTETHTGFRFEYELI